MILDIYILAGIKSTCDENIRTQSEFKTKNQALADKEYSKKRFYGNLELKGVYIQ